MENVAVLVIDVQQGLFNPEPADCQCVVERINQLTVLARASQCPVIFIQHHTPGDDALAKGSSRWQLYSRLIVEPGDHRVDKTTPDSFLRTSLDALLASLNVRHLIIAGYSSEFCIDTTVRRAAGLGYRVTLAADAHTSHDKAHASGVEIRQHHNLTLSAIESFGVSIEALDSAEICRRYLSPEE
ncbi:MAG: Peroxyureidoacrylate/ureidoacrylate amidohydrolase RutB [Candidatus Celerinatantimonas neptuna]|nr:MAG: Peroxyureidoacrylate/ureidoacrylate amidohydrolase RutB [Candidatus Celerinatantimonas neptuna]